MSGFLRSDGIYTSTVAAFVAEIGGPYASDRRKADSG